MIFALLFFSDVHNNLRYGEYVPGFIKNIREDGKIDVSWNLGLSDWLDPLNLNPTSLDGIEGSTITSDDVVISFLNKPDAVNCGANIKQEILLSNLGTNTATSISFEYGLDNNIQTYNVNFCFACIKYPFVYFCGCWVCIW